MKLILQPAINISYQHGRLRTCFINVSHLTRDVMVIQSVTGGTDQNSGECSLGHTISI